MVAGEVLVGFGRRAESSWRLAGCLCDVSEQKLRDRKMCSM